MGTKTDVDLLNFFIFNSEYGFKEGEEEKKVLFYYPNSDSLNTKIRNVGLVEGVRQFTSTFKPDKPLSALHTQKTRQLYYEPEKNFWMVLTLRVPYVTQAKDGNNYCEYLEDDIQDDVYDAVLKQAYLMYRLFNNTYTLTVKEGNVTVLREKLGHFYSAYLKTVKWAHCDISNIFSGIQFLPLNSQTFLGIQCFVNSLECNYPSVERTAVMYNDHLIWSGIDPEDMHVIYEYLIGTLLPASLETELKGGSMPRNPSPFKTLPHGRFITGNATTKAPRIYTFSEKSDSYNMLVYRILSMTVCLFVNVTEKLTPELLKTLDAFMNPTLTALVTSIGEYCHKFPNTIPANVPEGAPRFVYFSKCNLAYKSSVHLDNKRAGNVGCTKDSLKVMADLYEKKKFLGKFGELIVKTTADYWVVMKTCNLREFYIALQQKNASVMDINDEIQKLCETELNGIFFKTL